MKKNQVQNIILHIVKHADSNSLSDRINEFHVQVIERRLIQSNLAIKQKVVVIDQIIENLKSREMAGVIK